MASGIRTINIGQVIRKHADWKAARVRVSRLKLDDYLGMYFNKQSHFWASDAEDKVKEGDIVMIKRLEEPQSDRIKHFVTEVVYPIGETVDPVTGRRCRGTKYMDPEDRKFPNITIDSIDSEHYK